MKRIVTVFLLLSFIHTILSGALQFSNESGPVAGASINAAIANIADGETLFVYSDTPGATEVDTTAINVSSGANRTIMKSPDFTGTIVLDGQFTAEEGIYINNRTGYTFKGFTIVNWGNEGVLNEGGNATKILECYIATNGKSGIGEKFPAINGIYASNTIVSNGAQGIYLYQTPENVLILSNRITEAKEYGINLAPFASTHYVRGCIIRSNLVYSNVGAALYSDGGMAGAVISNNTVEFNRFGPFTGFSQAGIRLYDATNNVIRYNTIFDVTPGIQLNSDCDGTEIYYNNFVNTTTDIANSATGTVIHSNYYGGRYYTDISVTGATITNWLVTNIQGDFAPPETPTGVFFTTNYVVNACVVDFSSYTKPADFARIDVFRTSDDNYSNFTLGGNRVGSVTEAVQTAFTDATTGSYYYITVVDTDGNESWYAKATPLAAAPPTTNYTHTLAVDNTLSLDITFNNVTNIRLFLTNTNAGTDESVIIPTPGFGGTTNHVFTLATNTGYSLVYWFDALNGSTVVSPAYYVTAFPPLAITRTLRATGRTSVLVTLSVSNVDTVLVTNVGAGEIANYAVGGADTNLSFSDTGLTPGATNTYELSFIIGSEAIVMTNEVVTFTDTNATLTATNTNVAITSASFALRTRSVTNLASLTFYDAAAGTNGMLTNFPVYQDAGYAFTLTNLAGDNAYTVVGVYDDYNGVRASNVFSFQTRAAAVENLALIPYPQLGYIRLQWSQTDAAHFLVVREGETNEASVTNIVTNSSATYFVDTDVVQNASYTYTVYAVNSEGEVTATSGAGDSATFTVNGFNLPKTNSARVALQKVVRPNAVGGVNLITGVVTEAQLDAATYADITVTSVSGAVIHRIYARTENNNYFGNWDMTSDAGGTVVNGVYIVRVTLYDESGQELTQKSTVMVVVQ